MPVYAWHNERRERCARQTHSADAFGLSLSVAHQASPARPDGAFERIGRLASGLSQIGVDQGDVVAVLEWDSDRYHECYFAVPMMGAALQTINVSLTPEDIAYTINDSGATTVLFNADFLPLIEKLKDT